MNVPYTFTSGTRDMADLPSAYPLHDLFDAAVRHRTIKLVCKRCGHVCIFDAHALWWHFSQRGWQDRFQDVRRRCVCTVCWYGLQQKINFPDLQLVEEEPNDTRLPMPPELEWKRELRRRR